MSAPDAADGEHRARTAAPGARGGTRRVAVLGEGERVRAFALVGVHVVAADDAQAARAAWRALPNDVGLVMLTQSARTALGDELDEQGERLWVAMPA